jgi:hypothetical protein
VDDVVSGGGAGAGAPDSSATDSRSDDGPFRATSLTPEKDTGAWADGAAGEGCRTTWAEDDAGRPGDVPGPFAVPATVTARAPLSVYRTKL